MTQLTRIHCIACKIMAFILSLMSLAFTPFSILYNDVECNLTNIIILVFLSGTFFMIGFSMLIKTNNPAYRWNLFTVDPSWDRKNHKSLDEAPGQIFEFNQPTKDQLRDKKVKEILRSDKS